MRVSLEVNQVNKPQFKVSSTNPTKAGSKSKVRVYVEGKLVIEREIAKRSPVKYLKSLTRSKHLRAIEMAIMPHGLTLTDIGLR